MKAFVKEITWLNGINHGWGNGYVCLPKGHKYFGMHYDDIPVNVSGGLTFSQKSEDCEENMPELPEECKKDHWVIGFDTAHYDDDLSRWPDADSVMRECENLMAQL